MIDEAHAFAALIRTGIWRANLVFLSNESQLHGYLEEQCYFKHRWGAEKCDIGSYGNRLIFKNSVAEIEKPVNLLKDHLKRNNDKIDILIPHVMHLVEACACSNEQLEKVALQHLKHLLVALQRESECDVIFVNLL